MKLRNIPGGVPEPGELIGRDHLIEVLWKQLEGNNILLVAPRRFGKTGVMRYVLKNPQAGYLPLYIDVEEITEPVAFAAELVSALLEQDTLRSLFSTAKRLPKAVMDLTAQYVDEVGPEEFKVKLKAGLGEAWGEVTKRLVLEMEKAKAQVVFLIDEFPQMIENISQIILDPQAATKEIIPDCLERIYCERLLGPTCRAYFAPYRERLKRYGEPGERAAIAILQELAQAPNGRISDSALYDVYRRARRKGATDLEFREIMADLEYDWYTAIPGGGS